MSTTESTTMTKPEACTREWHLHVLSSDALLREHTNPGGMLRITARVAYPHRRCRDCGCSMRITMATARRIGN